MLSCLILSITFRRWWFFFCNGYNLQWKIKTKRTLTYCVSKEENLSYGSWVLLLRYFRLFYDACKDSFTLSQRESTVSFRACQQLFEIELLQNGSLFFLTQVTFTDPCCVFPFVGVCSARNPLHNRAVCFCKDVCVILRTDGAIHDNGKPLTTT